MATRSRRNQSSREGKGKYKYTDVGTVKLSKAGDDKNYLYVAYIEMDGDDDTYIAFLFEPKNSKSKCFATGQVYVQAEELDFDESVGVLMLYENEHSGPDFNGSICFGDLDDDDAERFSISVWLMGQIQLKEENDEPKSTGRKGRGSRKKDEEEEPEEEDEEPEEDEEEDDDEDEDDEPVKKSRTSSKNSGRATASTQARKQGGSKSSANSTKSTKAKASGNRSNSSTGKSKRGFDY